VLLPPSVRGIMRCDVSERVIAIVCVRGWAIAIVRLGRIGRIREVYFLARSGLARRRGGLGASIWIWWAWGRVVDSVGGTCFGYLSSGATCVVCVRRVGQWPLLCIV